MAPKKKGPFYFLLLELQKERRERNLPFSLDAVREEAGERWKSLTEEQKAYYEALANRHKEMKVGSLENKLTSDGRTIASVLREQSEEINQRKEMVASIQRYVDDIGTVDEIKKFPFYILATNILCEANGVYYPLEIGLIEYSIEQGFIRAYHKFINPGRIPLGFASAAKDHRSDVELGGARGPTDIRDTLFTAEGEDTHGIPITGFELGTTNYRAVVQDLMAYLRLTQDDPVLPPFFCMPHHMPQAEGVLRWLEEHARCELDFPIWDIEMLLRKLRSVVGEDISHAEAENILSSALFDYELKSLCQYHMEIDNKNCALGEARRLGFKMSNALVNAYRVERIIEYQHLPPRYDPSLTFEVSQMNLRPTPRGGSSRRPIGGSGDPNSYNRSNYAGAAPPLQREPRRPEDYYGESRGPRVVRNPQPGPSTAGAAAPSVDTLVDDFPSLGESMLGCKPPPGYFNYSSSTQSPNESDTDSFTTECSVSSGARPKTGGAAAARRSVASSLVDQFTKLAPTEQGIGRGAPVAGARHVQSPGGNSFFQMPRQPRTEPAYIKIRKPSDDPAGAKGMGRGNF